MGILRHIAIELLRHRSTLRHWTSSTDLKMILFLFSMYQWENKYIRLERWINE